ncbi:hypothetical protein [Micromonospora sagamiensis]|uniref:Uncharacterized protein n=1 Tax=Micromonospora sagamiensis TaxID=47875 RepID=A0A562WL59_9ACTN|nr:hypothetical protein [Micromonospora sagamiensis]TWJ31020.1 hypothetical protein JD81_04572 [Micromonospora sagamiensis]BCL15938.1 membrane protein [Micromonospora sagamiensis]
MSAATLTSTTRRDLRRHRRALLVATAVALAGCLSVFLVVHRTADAVARQSVPSVLAVYDTQVALRAAHGAALAGFSDGTRLLGGPGEEYQNRIAAAGQHLAEVAERNAAGETGSGDIQVVEALLVTYTGLIARADVHFRQDRDSALGTASLWDAASLLEELLLRLDRLREAQLRALDDQVGRVWTSPAAAAVWLLPVLVLVGLLVRAQRFLRRRFRRRLNAPLLLATLFVVLMGVATSSSLWSAGQLTAARESISEVDGHRREQLALLAAGDTDRLTDRLEAACGGRDGCPRTIDLVTASGGAPPDGDTEPAGPKRGTAPAATTADPAGDARTNGDVAIDRATRAANSFGGEIVLSVAALCAAVAVLLGFQPRLDEYRYHER